MSLSLVISTSFAMLDRACRRDVRRQPQEVLRFLMHRKLCAAGSVWPGRRLVWRARLGPGWVIAELVTDLMTSVNSILGSTGRLRSTWWQAVVLRQ